MVRGHKPAARVQPSNQSSQSTVRGDSATIRADSSNPITPGTSAPNSQRPSPASTISTGPEPTSKSLSAPDTIIPPGSLFISPQSVITPPDKNPTTESLRQQVTKAFNSPKKRQRKISKVNDGEEVEELSLEEIAEIRKLDRATRWHCFLYFTNCLWFNIAKECYGDAFDIDSEAGQTVRMKVFDLIKGIKHKTLEHMEEHVKEIMVAPEHVAVKGLYTTRPLLLDFFAKLFTPGNFFAVWRYMRGYVEFEGSSELGQYYMKSIYINLAIEMKLYLDICTTSPKGKNNDARERLLTFYNEVPTHKDFGDVDKAEFKEIQERYRNQHTPTVKEAGETLKECFLSIGAPPPKKKQMVDGPTAGSGAPGAAPSVDAGAGLAEMVLPGIIAPGA